MARRLMHAAAAALVVFLVSGSLGWIQAAAGSDGQPVGLGSIAAGRAHTVMAMPDGRVFAWGAGGRGQIGDGGGIDRWTPTLVPGLRDIVSVAAGAAHSVAVTKAGDVYAWGANASGRLGDGTTTRRLRPVHIVGLQDVAMIAAGRAHTLALTSNGHVFEWGRTTAGEKGKGKNKAMLIPTRVSGLSDVVAIAAGDAHSLAVLRDGRVFAWGNNQFSALGDGTAKDRAHPVAITLTDVVAVAAGGSHSLALSRNGAVYSWGRGANGELGTGSTKVASIPKIIPGLQASAIAAGGQFSAAIRSDGRVVAWGANGSGQLGNLTATRALRPVVVNGLESIVSLALGDAHAIAVTKAGDVRVWGEGESGRLGSGSERDHASPLEVISDIPDWDGASGPPQPPVMAPITGVYPVAQTVTLTGASTTDVVRFTLDGSEPDETSTVYTSPFTVSTSLTVVARSFSSSGEASAVRAETYTIDTTPPSIVASTSPALQAGWMTVPVTVTFQCADDLGIASCPAPVTVSQDGYAQQIVGTAIDRAGHQTTASVVVNVDVNPPVLSITEPADATTVDTADVLVTGIVYDGGSGVSDARCNGQPAQLVGTEITCSVQLSAGRNGIILSAVDALGHNASAAVSITRVGTATALTLTPATRAMVVSEQATLALRDEFGALVDGALWSTSDGDVVRMSDSDPPELTAIAVGQVTITAEKDGLTATATVDVSAGIAPGATRWTLPPLPQTAMRAPIFTNRVDPAVPHMFTVETPNPADAILRAVTSDGEVLWQQRAGGIPLMGDSFGGVLVGAPVDEEWGGNYYRAYLHVGAGSIRPWRYDSLGELATPAQAREGTIYAIEYVVGGLDSDGYEIWDKHAIAIDGATGRLISRTPLTREVDEFISDNDGLVLNGPPPLQCRSTRYDWAPETQGPVVGSDGRGYLVVRRHVVTKRDTCVEPLYRRADRTISMGIDVVILSPNAAPQVVNVFTTSCTAGLGTTMPCDLPVRSFQLMPDGIGGTLVTWERGTQMVGNAVFVQKSLTRVDADGATFERPVPRQFWLEMIGQAGTAYAYDQQWTAFDVTTGTIQWAKPLPNLGLLGALPDGGAATLDFSDGQLKMIDAAANVVSTQPLGLEWGAVHAFGDWIGLRNGQLAAVTGDFSDATRFQALRGNAQKQQTVRMPGFGIWLKTHNAIEPLSIFQHTSLRITPFNQKWLKENAQMFEQCTPPAQCVPLERDVFDNLYFTIGAGPGSEDTSIQCSGILKKGFNRPNDVTTPPTAPLKELPVAFPFQAIAINSILQRFDGYANALGYHCFPEERPGFYNSNSFIHGLLHAASIAHDEAPPTRQRVPGWLTLVPSPLFSR